MLQEIVDTVERYVLALRSGRYGALRGDYAFPFPLYVGEAIHLRRSQLEFAGGVHEFRETLESRGARDMAAEVLKIETLGPANWRALIKWTYFFGADETLVAESWRYFTARDGAPVCEIAEYVTHAVPHDYSRRADARWRMETTHDHLSLRH